MKKKLWIAAFLIGLFTSGRIYFYLTDGFHPNAIVHSVPFDPKWNIPFPAEDTLAPLFKETFTYLGKGAQSYVFLSHDGTHVLKFFKAKHLVPSWPDILLPWKIEKRKMKKNNLFQGYLIAYKNNAKESGLVAVRLTTNTKIGLVAKVQDKLGRTFHIPLEDIPFILQERATPFKDVLTQALLNHDLSLAKKKIDQIFDYYPTEHQKGIFDEDRAVTHNMGFIGERVVRFDVGKMREGPSIQDPLYAKENLQRAALRLKEWLHNHFPEHYQELSSYIDIKLHPESDT